MTKLLAQIEVYVEDNRDEVKLRAAVAELAHVIQHHEEQVERVHLCIVQITSIQSAGEAMEASRKTVERG